jgi:hypothetical protein
MSGKVQNHLLKRKAEKHERYLTEEKSQEKYKTTSQRMNSGTVQKLLEK